MNILIKLMSIVSLVIAPTLASIYTNHEGNVDPPPAAGNKTTAVAKTPSVRTESALTAR